jgi:hypothetical protein
MRVSVLTIAGTAHLMLVFGGCIFYRDLLAPSFPAVRHLGWMAALVSLMSLVWPIYIFAAFPGMAANMAEGWKARAEKKRAERKP